MTLPTAVVASDALATSSSEAFFVYGPGTVVNETVGACVSIVHAIVASGFVPLPLTAWIRSV